MNRYSQESKCPKCGWRQVSTQCVGQNLRRTCTRCGYYTNLFYEDAWSLGMQALREVLGYEHVIRNEEGESP